MGEGPIARYRALAEGGVITKDPAQELAAEKLETLHHRLAEEPRRTAAPGGLRGLFSRVRATPPETETRTDYQGLYLYGGVGRGKSMLMDLFFDGAPVDQKRRVHFHAFMLEVHGQVHRWRQMDKRARAKEWGAGFARDDDPIPPVASRIADGAHLLCFDEFQVTDVADAMILSRLFTLLFEAGVWVVATSNRAPSALYQGGLNRPLFEPFIDLVYHKLDVLHLDSPTDYRLDRLMGHPVYHAPWGAAATRALNQSFTDLTDAEGGEPCTLTVQGRTLPVPEQARGVARFGFEDLCAKPLGAADYLAIAEAFHTVLIDDIPALSPAKRNEAKRFVTLIDALYENKVRLICSAEVGANELYPAGDGAFEFERTVSRLLEMQSQDYLAARAGGAA